MMPRIDRTKEEAAAAALFTFFLILGGAVAFGMWQESLAGAVFVFFALGALSD